MARRNIQRRFRPVRPAAEQDDPLWRLETLPLPWLPRAPQLFHLANDPDEWSDLGSDPCSAEVRELLLARVLAGWDGGAIQRHLDQQRNDYKILTRWNRQVQPAAPDHWKPPADVDAADLRDPD